MKTRCKMSSSDAVRERAKQYQMEDEMMERVEMCIVGTDLAELWVMPWGDSAIIIEHVGPTGRVSTVTLWKPKEEFKDWRRQLEHFGLVRAATSEN